MKQQDWNQEKNEWLRMARSISLI